LNREAGRLRKICVLPVFHIKRFRERITKAG